MAKCPVFVESQYLMLKNSVDSFVYAPFELNNQLLSNDNLAIV